MEEIAGNDHGVGVSGDDTIDGASESLRDIRLALVDPGGVQPLVLSDAEMSVGKVCKLHTINVS
jgi:hypothetical protein